MDYNDYNLEDFIADEHFVDWVKKPNEENSLFWRNWLLQNPGKKDLIEEARQVVVFLGLNASQPSHEDFKEVKGKIFSQIRNIDDKIEGVATFDIKQSSETRQLSRKLYRQAYFKAAAIFIGLLVISAILFFNNSSSGTIQYTTSFGETKPIDLPDGSTVVLNSNSKIIVPASWDTGTREVWLEGEAFFNVQKKLNNNSGSQPGDEHIKFKVHVGKLEVEVIGTQFNINNRRGTVKVVLKSGQVNLTAEEEKIIMQPGDMVEFSPKSKAFTIKTVEAEKYTSWRHKKLMFEETTITEIAQIIEDNYGLKVNFKNDALKSRRFTGAVPYQDVNLFLEVLEESLDIKIDKYDNNIIMNTK